MFEKFYLSAMAHAWIITPENDRMSQLVAGRTYVRLNLQATSMGLALHPHSQLLQEYPEMKDLQDEYKTSITRLVPADAAEKIVNSRVSNPRRYFGSNARGKPRKAGKPDRNRN